MAVRSWFEAVWKGFPRWSWNSPCARGGVANPLRHGHVLGADQSLDLAQLGFAHSTGSRWLTPERVADSLP